MWKALELVLSEIQDHLSGLRIEPAYQDHGWGIQLESITGYTAGKPESRACFFYKGEVLDRVEIRAMGWILHPEGQIDDKVEATYHFTFNDEHLSGVDAERKVVSAKDGTVSRYHRNREFIYNRNGLLELTRDGGKPCEWWIYDNVGRLLKNATAEYTCTYAYESGLCVRKEVSWKDEYLSKVLSTEAYEYVDEKPYRRFQIDKLGWHLAELVFRAPLPATLVLSSEVLHSWFDPVTHNELAVRIEDRSNPNGAYTIQTKQLLDGHWEQLRLPDWISIYVINRQVGVAYDFLSIDQDTQHHQMIRLDNTGRYIGSENKPALPRCVSPSVRPVANGARFDYTVRHVGIDITEEGGLTM
jgi:hypothetical protein